MGYQIEQGLENVNPQKNAVLNIQVTRAPVYILYTTKRCIEYTCDAAGARHGVPDRTGAGEPHLALYTIYHILRTIYATL